MHDKSIMKGIKIYKNILFRIYCRHGRKGFKGLVD